MAAYIGTGFIILAVLWIACIVLCLVFARCEGGAAYIGILLILIAIIVTLALWFYPRGTTTPDTYVVYDYTYVPRTALVSILGVMLLVGMVTVAFLHVFDQHHGTPVKPWAY